MAQDRLIIPFLTQADAYAGLATLAQLADEKKFSVDTLALLQRTEQGAFAVNTSEDISLWDSAKIGAAVAFALAVLVYPDLTFNALDAIDRPGLLRRLASLVPWLPQALAYRLIQTAALLLLGLLLGLLLELGYAIWLRLRKNRTHRPHVLATAIGGVLTLVVFIPLGKLMPPLWFSLGAWQLAHHLSVLDLFMFFVGIFLILYLGEHAIARLFRRLPVAPDVSEADMQTQHAWILRVVDALLRRLRPTRRTGARALLSIGVTIIVAGILPALLIGLTATSQQVRFAWHDLALRYLTDHFTQFTEPLAGALILILGLFTLAAPMVGIRWLVSVARHSLRRAALFLALSPILLALTPLIVIFVFLSIVLPMLYLPLLVALVATPFVALLFPQAPPLAQLLLTWGILGVVLVNTLILFIAIVPTASDSQQEAHAPTLEKSAELDKQSGEAVVESGKAGAQPAHKKSAPLKTAISLLLGIASSFIIPMMLGGLYASIFWLGGKVSPLLFRGISPDMASRLADGMVNLFNLQTISNILLITMLLIAVSVEFWKEFEKWRQGIALRLRTARKGERAVLIVRLVLLIAISPLAILAGIVTASAFPLPDPIIPVALALVFALDTGFHVLLLHLSPLVSAAVLAAVGLVVFALARLVSRSRRNTPFLLAVGKRLEPGEASIALVLPAGDQDSWPALLEHFPQATLYQDTVSDSVDAPTETPTESLIK